MFENESLDDFSRHHDLYGEQVNHNAFFQEWKKAQNARLINVI